MKDTLTKFVSDNFGKEGTELESVTPDDWIEEPTFVEDISADEYKELALQMNAVWKNLTRKFGTNQSYIESYSSLIYLDHPFVVPGGRFREVYYWDSYWTIKGLLLSQMYETVKVRG